METMEALALTERILPVVVAEVLARLDRML
jgi:hypothetical protein